MMNILVPTDFSELSKVAIQYAIQFANRINGTVTLVHVVNLIQPARKSMRVRVLPIEKELVNKAKAELLKMATAYSSQVTSGNPIQIRVGKGSTFPEAVKKEAKRLRAGLIIMGTRGASGLKKYIVGSNTASVIDLSSVPVLVVPELGAFKNLRNIVYATDLKHTEKELKRLIPYVNKFEAIVHLIHVTGSVKQVVFLEKKIDAIVEKSAFNNVIVRVLVNKKVDEAIDQYVTTIKGDLLATFTHEHGFYDKLFNRSITRKIAFQSKIPLLAFKQSSLVRIKNVSS
jgi:nucleotide-binding universal stress UspA family protein